MSRLTRNACTALDAQDPLAALRGEFALPPGVAYLRGLLAIRLFPELWDLRTAL